MKLFPLLTLVALIGLGSPCELPAQDSTTQAATEKAATDKAAAEKAAAAKAAADKAAADKAAADKAAADKAGAGGSLIRVSDSTDIVEIGDTIRIGLFGTFGQEISNKLKTDGATTKAGLKLYLNGVAMTGLAPEALPPAAFTPKQPPSDNKAETKTQTKSDSKDTSTGTTTETQAGPPPVLVLQFALERDSNNEANRKAWDELLPRLNYGKNSIQVGVGLNNEVPHLTETKELQFRVRHGAVIALVIFAGLIALYVLMHWALSGNMLRDAGDGTAYSLGKTQMAFWGLLVALCFLGVFLVGHKMERIPPQVLVLLGISGTTGLASVLIRHTKESSSDADAQKLTTEKDELKKEIAALEAEKKTLEDAQTANPAAFPDDKKQRLAVVTESLASLNKKLTDKATAQTQKADDATAAPSSGNWFKDIISEDANTPSFHRFQVVLWTVILGGVFVWTVANTFTMPEFDNTLLILMGISNGVYLGFKYPEK